MSTSIDLKLEVVVIPVSDVDRSKDFYSSLGWRLDADFPNDNGFRIVQLTHQAPGARSSSARRSPQHRRDRRKVSI
jgi:catechol 2,3-dioxygenase-like lactoylglutathione lyase family enzyme